MHRSGQSTERAKQQLHGEIEKHQGKKETDITVRSKLSSLPMIVEYLAVGQRQQPSLLHCLTPRHLSYWAAPVPS